MIRPLMFWLILCATPLAGVQAGAQTNPSNPSSPAQQPGQPQQPGDANPSAMPNPMPPGFAPTLGSAAGSPVQSQPRGPVRISGRVMAGRILTRVDPIYPPEAKAQRFQGSVVLLARISREGTVQDVRLVSGPAVLGDAALAAVRQWTYQPYLLNGTPVEVDTTVTVTFNLDTPSAPNPAPL